LIKDDENIIMQSEIINKSAQ